MGDEAERSHKHRSTCGMRSPQVYGNLVREAVNKDLAHQVSDLESGMNGSDLVEIPFRVPRSEIRNAQITMNKVLYLKNSTDP